MKSASQRFLSYALILHPNAHATRGRPTLNDVERFRNGPVHELSSLKASQMCKVHTISHEITNGFNTCKVRFGISYIITIIIVQAIVNVGLLSAWSCMFFVEHMMNTLDDCDLQEKVPI